MAGMCELERVAEPSPARSVEARKHSRKIVIVLGARVLRLEQEHDLGPRVRNAAGRALDELVVRKTDARVSAADPRIAVGGLAHDVQPPESRLRLLHPRLVVLVERGSASRQRPREAVSDDKELEARERGADVIETIGRHADLDVVVRTSLSAEEEVDRPPGGDVPRRSHIGEKPLNLFRAPRLPCREIRRVHGGRVCRRYGARVTARRALLVVRLALAAFVLLWLFGPYTLRASVPMWLPFAIALGLELHLFLAPSRRVKPDRLPQAVDRARYGYGGGVEELVVVGEGRTEHWIPYRGETQDELRDLTDDGPDDEEPVVAPPRRRRPLQQLLVGVAVVAALGAVVWFVDSRTGWEGLSTGARSEAGARFSAEASRIAGRPVTIRCDEGGDFVGAVQHADGVAAVGGNLAYLTPEICLDLYRLAFDGEVRSSQTGRAIAVLAHEAWHLRGVRDEGMTECYALQSGVEIGRRLGLSESASRRLMRQQLLENSRRGASSLEYVVPSTCRDGGALDLRRDDSAFP